MNLTIHIRQLPRVRDMHAVGVVNVDDHVTVPPMPQASSGSQGQPRPSRLRQWPVWVFQTRDAATIGDALSEFFWAELERGVQQYLIQLENCATEAGLQLTRMAKQSDVPPFIASEERKGCRNETCDPHRAWTQDADTDEKRALKYLARAILQTAGQLAKTHSSMS